MGAALYEHNRLAYQAASALLASTGKAAVVHPTGTGKSFIGLKLCEEHTGETVCWLSPSEYIFKTQLENWRKAGGEELENIRFFTYAKLMLLSPEELEEIRPAYIILDEFHRCGAEAWGQGVQRLLNAYPSAPILGLSATNIRYLDNQRDMADELFDGNIASAMSLGEAIVRGILNPPKYVLSVYSCQKDLDRYAWRIKNAKNKAVRDEAEKCLEALRRALDKAEGLDEIFAQHMEDKAGKYIVFCANFEHMHEMMDKAGNWFRDVDTEPHIYSVYSEDPENSKAFRDFKADNSGHLKLLYCIDMLNEGIHVEDVSGVILLRPTVSPILYKQQIGRALSTGSKKSAVIFDVVLNIENLYSIGSIEEEMRLALSYYRSLGRESEIVNEAFRVEGQVRDCLELFRKLNESLGASWELMFAAAERYAEEYGNLEVPKRYVTPEGFSLGSWLHTQRQVYAGKAPGILTQEQITRLESIGMRWQSVRDLAWERNYAEAQSYYAEHGDLLVSAREERNGIALGRWIAQLRNCRKNGLQSAYLTNERIQALDAIGMIWDVPDYLWERNYYAAVEYHREHGNLDVPAYYVTKDGIRLGAWLRSLRGSELTEIQRARLDALGMTWETRRNVGWEKSYAAAKAYYELHGNLEIPVSYVTEDGCHLGRWVRRQRGAENLSPERRERLEAIGMAWGKDDPWQKKYELAKQYYVNYGNANIPGDYVIDGIWLSRWLNEQQARLNGKPTGRSKTVKPLTEEQVRQLELLGIRRNRSRSDQSWERQYAAAKRFYQEHGHLNIPKRYEGDGGKSLGSWLIRQREKRREGSLSPERIALLEEIGISWVGPRSRTGAWERPEPRARL